MKTPKLLLALALCCGGLLALAPIGCSTANLTAYKATATIRVSVESAMTVWGDWIKHQDAAGTPVPMEQRAKVKAAYEKYQAAATVVADAGVGYVQSKGTTNETGAQAVLNTAMSIASASLADLTALIHGFGVKL